MKLDREAREAAPQDTRQSTARAARDLLAHNAGSVLIVGGLLWVTTYIVEIVIGVRLGEEVYAHGEVTSSWLMWLWPATFAAATLFLTAGLLGVALQLGRRGRVLAALGGVVACVGLVASMIHLVHLTGVLGTVRASDDLGFLGVVGVMGGSVLIGAATWRAQLHRRAIRITLTFLPLAFVPGILATIPLESVAPDYVVADLPFPIVGLVLAAVGLTLRRDRR